MTISDETIAAYVDGEMEAAARAALEREMEEDTALRGRVEAERRLRHRLSAHFAPALSEPVPTRLSALITEGAPTNVVQLDSVRPFRQRMARLPLWQAAAALAATLVLGVVTGRQIGDDSPALVGSGGVIADRSLRSALDEQLASNQPAGAPVRIGLSFADGQGALCRTFDSRALAGVACHERGAWRLRFAAAGAAADRTEYRQAASAGPLVMQAAEAMMQGTALNPQEERSARDRGWRPLP